MLPGKNYALGDFLLIARRRAWLLVTVPIATTFAALVYSASLPNLYQSDMLMAIVPQRVPDAFVRSTVTLRSEDRLDAISVQVMSRTVLEQLIRELNLYPDERQRLPMQDVVQQMHASIQVELERPRRGPRGPEPPNAFHVRFTYSDPNIAAAVTQRLGSLFADQNARDRGALAEATNDFLETQLAEARGRLEAQERRVEEFRERHGKELPTQQQSNLQAIQSTQLQIQALVESIARDRDRKLMLERLYNEAVNEPAPITPNVGQQPQAGGDSVAATTLTAQQQLATARATLARLELRLQPGHPDVIRTRRLIRELEPKAAAEAAGARSTEMQPAATPEEAQRRERLRQMLAEIESLDRQTLFKESEERRLRALVAEYQRRIEAVPGVESQWAALTRDYDTLQAGYRDLLNKSEASKVAVDLEKRQIGEQFRILDPAGVPVRPISPIRIQINGIGLAAGLALAVALVALLELRDTSFRTEADVLTVVALPVLATVPLVLTSEERRSRRWRRAAFAAAGCVIVVVAGYVFWTMRLWSQVL